MKKHCDNCTHLAVDDRELATILAALRFHQAENLQGAGGIPDQAICEIATEMGHLDALTFDEVEQLCQRFNLTDRDITGPDVFELRQSQNVPEGIQRIYDLLYLDVVNDRELYDPDKQWNADTISMVAEVVAEYIPRPEPGQEQMNTIIITDTSRDSRPCVILSVSGGVADVMFKPAGIGVIIFDYDVEGADTGSDRIERDHDGADCCISEWPASEPVIAKEHWPIVERVRFASIATCCHKWKCPTCGRQVESSYEELAEVGAPYCSDCDSEMEMI